MTDLEDPDFFAKQAAARERINQIDAETLSKNPRREDFFETVYDEANGDPVGVPWADLAAKDKLASWLETNAPHSGRAIDVGCGLGDNAEALAETGYDTTAFDFSEKAIKWARKRFPTSSVKYHVADLFKLPDQWLKSFDLVHECYTLQSIPTQTLSETIPAVASLVAPGGALLVYSRIVEDGTKTEGPPWPVERSSLASFTKHGLVLEDVDEFDLVRPDKTIPHQFSVWRRPE